MRTVLIVGILMIIAVNGFASSVKVESKISDGDVSTDIHLYHSAPVSAVKGLSVFGYSLTGKSYSEAYAGLGYTPVLWLSVGLGAGLETGGARIATFLWAGKGQFSLLAFYENGETGPWYKIVASWNATDLLTVGLQAKRFAGLGPMVQIAVPSVPVKIYAVPSYDFEFNNSSVIVGVSLKM